jgi:iron-sulfur cluster assembly protein
MLTVTENAASAIRAIVQGPELPDTAGLRIFTMDSPSDQLALSTAVNPESGDQIVENAGARVFLEPAAAAKLGDQVLDAEVGDDGKVEFSCHPFPGSNGTSA